MHFRLPAAIGFVYFAIEIEVEKPMDRISFESTNLLRRSAQPNPLASKIPKENKFPFRIAWKYSFSIKEVLIKFSFCLV
jgi:hypothetical protein